jgi:alcohol dehydrogenase (cytochrome c)
MTSRSTAEKATAEMVYAIDNETMITPGTENVGTVRAYSAETGREEWTYDQRAGVMGLLATGGDLVFGGDLAGIFRALDAETGELLWQTDLGAPVTGHPVAFAVGGRQYVAVSTGRANLTGTLGRLAPEARTDGASRLFVFAVR